MAVKLVDQVSKIVDQGSLDLIVSNQIGQLLFTALQLGNTEAVTKGFKAIFDDDEKAEDAAKEFIKAQLPNILGEDKDNE